VNTVAWSNGGLLASSAEDGQIILRDAADDFHVIRTLDHPGATHCAWSPDGERLAVASQDGHVPVWDGRGDAPAGMFRAASQPVLMLAWAPDGSHFASASKDGAVRLWRSRSHAGVRTLFAHVDHAIAVCFSSDGALLASKARDHSIVVWRTDLWHPV